jgi:hypothetical protein
VHLQRPTQRILFAVTSHGLGHLTRSLAVAKELRRLAPRVELIVATTAPEARVALDLPPPFVHRPVAYEPGTLQRSCFEVDVEGTRTAYTAYLEKRGERLEEEIRFLRRSGCTAVVSDIPALPVRAAAALGLPAVGLGNFTWDWILEPLLEGSLAAEAIRALADDYARGLVQLRLPFGPETSPFPRSEAAPLVSRRATLTPEVLRGRLGLPPPGDDRLVVVCPGGWDPDAWDPIRVSGCREFRFVTVGDLPIRAEAPLSALPHELPHGISFPDMVAAADVVLAKPGYGIASECLAHRTALVSIERADFRETPVLVEGFRRLGPCAELSLADFFAGRWEASLSAALASGARWGAVPEGGARRVARRLGELLGLEGSPSAPLS